MEQTVNKAVLGLESCVKRLQTGTCPYTCPYRKKSGFRNECLLKLMKNALAILQEDQKRILETGDSE